MTTSVSDTRTSLLDTLSTCSGTDIGRRREENQDALGVILGENLHFYIVADGMGGVQGGAVASKLAIETFAEQFEGVTASELNCERIRSGIQAANGAIHRKGNADTSLSGMGTTFVGVAVTEERMLLFNVGDSRAYRIRNSRILQLTQDHTLVSDLIRSGAITPEQAENHPVSHMLTRSLGPAESVEPDCTVMEDGPAGGDVYLLCSDGLYNLVSDREILRIFLNKDLEEAKDELIRLANERGGTDNITVVLIKVTDEYPVDSDQFPESEASIGFDEGDTVELEIDLNGHIRNAKSGQEFAIPEVEEDEAEEQESPVIEEGVSISDVQQSTQHKLMEQQGISIEEDEASVGDEFEGSQDHASRETDTGEENESSQERAEGESTTSESGTRRRLSTGMMIVGGVVAVFILVGLLLSEGSSVPEGTQTLSSAESGNTVPAVNVPEQVDGGDSGLDDSTQPVDTAAEIGDGAEKNETSSAFSEGNREVPDEAQPELTVVEEDALSTVPGLEGLEGLEGLTFREVQGIRVRKESLQKNIVRLNQRLKAFGAPYSGNLAEVLVKTSRERQELEEKLEKLQEQIDVATRDLATWYSRQKRLKSESRSMKLVEEISSSSDAVKAAKSDFENTTWEYLKQAEALRYSPTDVALQEKVKKLIASRKVKQTAMYEIAEKEIASAISASNEKILELNVGRDETKKSVDELLDELDYLKVLMSGSEEERAKLKASLEIELLRSQAALEELERILSD